jgi:FkbM family methyltransferase
MSLGDGTDAYEPLLARNLARVVGFEPIEEECARRNATADDSMTVMPYAIGSGDHATFHRCSAPMTSSLLAPNTALLDQFNNLAELVIVEETSEIETHKLDDIEGLPDTDLLKIDVQGAELDVLHGAERVLSEALVIHTEVSFVPIYVDQPLFADIDQHLRARGFAFHRFAQLHGRNFKPLIMNDDPNAWLGQTLWADAVYVRDFMRLSELTTPKLLKLATILHEVYAAFDFVATVLGEIDKRASGNLHDAYYGRLTSAA